MQTLFYRGSLILSSGDLSVHPTFPNVGQLSYIVSDRISSSGENALNIGLGIETFRDLTSYTKLLVGQIDENGPYIYSYDIMVEGANPVNPSVGDYSIGTVASGLWEDMGEPTNVSVSYISGWLSFNIGKLNNWIGTNYSGVSNGFVSMDYYGNLNSGLGAEELDIYKMLFWYAFYSRALVQSLGAASVDPVIEIQDDSSIIRVINKNELSKTWMQAKKDIQEDITQAVRLYKDNHSNPVQAVEYDAQKAIYRPDVYRLYYQRLV